MQPTRSVGRLRRTAVVIQVENKLKPNQGIGTRLKVVMPGGSGQVGTILARAFRRDGHHVVIIGRSQRGDPYFLTWDGRTTGKWVEALNGADVVINLAGRSVNCRYGKRNRCQILTSRVDSTRAVGAALRLVDRPPALWLQASTATIYAHTFDREQDEFTGTLGGGEPGSSPKWDFSIDVARAWEKAADDASVPGVRCVKLRSAMVMSPDRGGVFDTLLNLVRLRLGGKSGSGRQYVSWIHHEDFVRALYWFIEHRELAGVVNVSSPCPLPNELFMRAIRDAWGARLGLPATSWMLEIGALLMRTETELILKSRRVVPGRLVRSGFEFCQPDWAEAARELCSEIRAT